MERFGKFMSGFLLGALIGGGLSILLAPYSGEQLRIEARQYVENTAKEVRLAASKKREELEIQLDDLRTPKKPEV